MSLLLKNVEEIICPQLISMTWSDNDRLLSTFFLYGINRGKN